MFCAEGVLIDNLYKTYFKDKNIVIANGDFSLYFKKLFNVLKKSDKILIDEYDIPLLIHELFLTAFNNFCLTECFYSKLSKGAAASLKNYICSNFSKPFSLQEISDNFCISKNQIINIFKNSSKKVLTFSWIYIILRHVIEAWLSLVERCVRDAEVACSNHVASILL